MPIKIGIIDSGVRINHPAFYSEELNGYSLKVINDEVVKFDDFVITGSGMCGKGYKEWVRVSDGGPALKVKVKLG